MAASIDSAAPERDAAMFWYGHDMNGWGYGLMGISMLAVWVLLIGAVAMVLRHNRNPAAHTGDVVAPLTADQLLAQRFARGEIDHDDYLARQVALRAHVQS